MADHSSATDLDATLVAWCAALVKQLDLGDVKVDTNAVLSLAGQVAHAVARPAAPLTAFVVGYAAGRAVERTGVTDAEAFVAASSVALDLARDGGFGQQG
ncbi:MAG TPA: DUF6457 domain-containing protein [Galbitalea sp.]|jgi:hypothetical protein|nr:DUF6457 domain-containing protein [Galbitalea sp.]